MSSNRLNKKRPIRKVRSVPIRQLSNTSSEGKKSSELKNNKMVDTQKTLTRILFDDADKRALDLIEKRSRLSENRVRR